MMTLKNLKLHNFLSHENTEIKFDAAQQLLIDGNSGSGKSSILEAIIWALYGTGRSSNSALIRRGTDKAEVELTLDNDGEEVVITRSVNKSKHSLAITIAGVAHPKTGVRELQEYIETDLTGASYMLFVNSIAYLQGGAESFVGQNATQRKELLLEIIKTIDFDDYYERTKTKITDTEVEEASAKVQLESTLEDITVAEGHLEKKASVEANIAAEELKLEEYGTEKAKLEKQLEGRTERQNTMSDKVSEAEKTQKRIVELEALIASGAEKKKVYEAKMQEPEENIDTLNTERQAEQTKLDAIRESIANVAKINAERAEMLQKKPNDIGYEGIIASIEKEIEEMGAHNTCPEGDECPNFKATLDRINGKKVLLKSNQEAYDKFKTDYAEWEAKFNTMQEIPLGELQVEEKRLSLSVSTFDERIKKQEERKNAAEQFQTIHDGMAGYVSELGDLTTKHAKQIEELEELKKLGDSEEETKAAARLAEVVALMEATRGKVKYETQELGILNNYEEKLPPLKKKAVELQEKLNTIQTNLKHLGLLKDAFGSKGIRALVIDYIIPELEEKINEILSQMSEFRVILDTQQEKASGDGNKEGLFITIVNDMGEEMPFENYSGGEKLKIVVAITEALATLQKCGFRLFDETWVGLDEMSLESFSRVLDTLLDQFPQVICVSHLTEIKSAFENQVKIVKHNGISRVE